VTPSEQQTPGIELIHTLRGHDNVVLRLTWSPDGKTLASTSVDKTIRLWDLKSGGLRTVLRGHYEGVNEVAWAPDGSWLISCSFDQTIRVWELNTGRTVRELRGHSGDVTSISVSPDGEILASGSVDSTVCFWRTDTWERVRVSQSHQDNVCRVAWSPNSEWLASCSWDRSLMVWLRDGTGLYVSKRYRSKPSSVAWSHDSRLLAIPSAGGAIRIEPLVVEGSRSLATLEGHTKLVRSAVFSFDDRILASSSLDHTVRLWQTDTWAQVAQIEEPAANYWPQGIAFHPKEPLLATFGEKDRIVRIWRLNIDRLLGIKPAEERVHYRNAKVVLLGDTGVGKTGLRMVLTGEPYQPSDSTFGRRVWTFESSQVTVDGGTENRETLLWDMAGQPAYRLIHQLHLNEVAAALVVFDARQAVGDPLASVRHWARALQLAKQREGDAGHLKAFLVVGRADVQGTPVSPERIEALKRECGFAGFFETSAKEGWKIRELSDAIRSGIAWDMLPSVSSPQLFETLKSFLFEEKKSGRALAGADDLFRGFQLAHPDLAGDSDLRAKFDICVSRLENRDLIRRLSFGGLILLQAELLDAYASAIVLGADRGFVAEEDALAGRFRMPETERLTDKIQEKLLLLATVEELLQHQLALREHSDQGSYLVFPSQFNRDWPDAPDPKGKSVMIRFEGGIQNIYATLAVRLAHSGVFSTSRDSMWRNASVFEADAGGECGLYLREFGDGVGELVLFFREAGGASAPTPESRFRFEAFVISHLSKWALAGSVAVERLFLCAACGTAVPQAWVEMMRARGERSFDCPCRRGRVSLAEPKDQIENARQSIRQMERNADDERDRRVSDIVVRGKKETGEYDVFLCYNRRDQDAVKGIAGTLKERKVRPWLDVWDLRPGDVWQEKLGEIIRKVKAAAVFVGPNQTGPFENIEIRALLRQFVDGHVRVIPVVLPGAQGEPQWSIFLQDFHRVDFRASQPEPMAELLYGITGVRS
jgi:WD40 repeat protein